MKAVRTSWVLMCGEESARPSCREARGRERLRLWRKIAWRSSSGRRSRWERVGVAGGDVMVDLRERFDGVSVDLGSRLLPGAGAERGKLRRRP